MNHNNNETESRIMKTLIMRLAQFLVLLVVAFVFVMSVSSLSWSDSSVADSASTKRQFGVKSSGGNGPAMDDWSSGIAPSLGKVALALVLVIGAIYLTLYLLKRGMGRRISRGTRGDLIQVIETTYLAPKRSLSVVRVGDKGALIAMSETSINLLMEIDNLEEKLKVRTSKSREEETGFVSALKRAKGQLTALMSRGVELNSASGEKALGVNLNGANIEAKTVVQAP